MTLDPCHLRSAPMESPRAVNVRQVNTALYANESKIFGAVKCARDCEAVESTLSNIDK